MAAQYEIKLSKDRQYYWTLQANNNEVLLVSETFPAKASAQNGIASAKENSPDDARYKKDTASNTQHFFTLRGANHEKLATSEMYTTAGARDKGIEAVKKVGPSAPTVDQT